MSNYIDIVGGNYTYYGTHGGPRTATGTVRIITDKQIQFGGYLSYACGRYGMTLVCDDGRRVWTKQ